MADQTVIGLTLCKVNGIYHLDVVNSRWSIKRANQQHVTGAGVEQAMGQEIPSGSMDEVIPRQKGLDWRSLKDFTIDIYDKETRSVIVASFSGCNWTGIDGSSDLSSAMTRKAVSWNGSVVNKA
jgi:hypothetical protein